MTRKKVKKEKTNTADHGPVELQQHGTFVEMETSQAGVKAIRNVTVDPVATYYRRGSITQTQYQAADVFAGQYRQASMSAVYSSMKFGHEPSGSANDEFLERINDNKKRVRAALIFVGKPLSSIVEHVAGNDQTAGSWDGVKDSKRPEIEGMVALRLALSGLADYYRLG
tara:strand:+ start:5300 stop:5806 length:507 start_codon:yes stop_codon:yes gene_type:complete